MARKLALDLQGIELQHGHFLPRELTIMADDDSKPFMAHFSLPISKDRLVGREITWDYLQKQYHQLTLTDPPIDSSMPELVQFLRDLKTTLPEDVEYYTKGKSKSIYLSNLMEESVVNVEDLFGEEKLPEGGCQRCKYHTKKKPHGQCSMAKAHAICLALKHYQFELL